MTVPPVRILLAEDHTLVRAGLIALLNTLKHVRVVAEVGDGQDVLRLARSTAPDVILMDITMKGLNGVEAAAAIVKDHPNIRVIMLSMHADLTYVRRALQAGASGYLLKGADVAELELSIKAVMRGETYLTPAVSGDLVKDLLQGARPADDPLAQLTHRQREILQLLAEGCSSKEIAQRLALSVKTVETHRADIMARLDIHDVAGLVRFAVRTGLISSE